MTLILNILDNKKGAWRLFTDSTEKVHEFAMLPGEENVLSELDNFLQQANFELKQIKAIGLSIKEASLTQVKVIVTIINTLGWQLDIPVTASFYLTSPVEINQQLLASLKNKQEFSAIIPEYSREAEITISQKTQNFEIEL
jgi:tRNA A37 threonylcarbamoyladenosine modification protein TsaB